jgi:tRNA-2-methylthio-N6-dimethylallyladenosine synthase
VGFAQAFSFKYSARPGTPAAGLRRQVAEAVKAARLRELQALLDSQAATFNAACVGRTLPVLLERPGRHPGQLVGRSPYLQAVQVSGPGLRVGDLVPVSIERRNAHSLAGAVAAAAPASVQMEQRA